MTEQGKTYMEKTGFKKFERVDEAEKKALDPFIQIFLENKK
jgi:hypothetical protein